MGRWHTVEQRAIGPLEEKGALAVRGEAVIEQVATEVGVAQKVVHAIGVGQGVREAIGVARGAETQSCKAAAYIRMAHEEPPKEARAVVLDHDDDGALVDGDAVGGGLPRGGHVGINGAARGHQRGAVRHAEEHLRGEVGCVGDGGEGRGWGDHAIVAFGATGQVGPVAGAGAGG